MTKSFTNLSQADHIVVSISGGKDSQVLMIQAQEMKKNFPEITFHYVHAIIDIDWDETLQVVQDQCDFFGVELNTVQAVDSKGNLKGILDHLVAPKMNRKKTAQAKTIEAHMNQNGKKMNDVAIQYFTNLLHETRDEAITENMVPNKANRWCTSLFKTGPIDKFVRKLKGNVAVLIGERGEESREREEMMINGEHWRSITKLNLKDGSRKVVHCSPLLDMKETEVWEIIEASGSPIHPVYSWGVSRASCAICVFSKHKEMKIAAERAPHIVAAWIEAESKISTSFIYAAATKKKPAHQVSISDILEKEGFDVSTLPKAKKLIAA